MFFISSKFFLNVEIKISVLFKVFDSCVAAKLIKMFGIGKQLEQTRFVVCGQRIDICSHPPHPGRFLQTQTSRYAISNNLMQSLISSIYAQSAFNLADANKTNKLCLRSVSFQYSSCKQPFKYQKGLLNLKAANFQCLQS